jgi:hypothetical protein
MLARGLLSQRMAQQRGGSAITFTQPPPLGGWNTRDDISAMPPQDAELLVNWLPDVNAVIKRGGSVQDRIVAGLTAIGYPITSIIEFSNDTITRPVITTDTTIIVGDSRLSTSTIASGFIAGDWTGVNFNNVMGLFNGTDPPQRYDGGTSTSSISALSLSGPADVRNLVEAHVHRGRVFYVEKNVCGFWYGEADTLGAALTFFPLSRVARYGGALLTIKSWTVDGGEGPDDYAVFIMDTGEIIVYQGNDPGRAATWGLIGRYKIGKPIARRGCVQMGAQIVVITEQDYVILPDAFKTPVPPATKLSGALKAAVENGAGLAGWQAVYYPKGGWLLFNVPTSVSTYEQHIINLRSGAATKFTGWQTRAFGVVDGDLFYGSLGVTNCYPVLFKANSGTDDSIATPGVTPLPSVSLSTITTQAWQAPSNLGKSLPKSVVDYRPRLHSEGDLSLESGLAYDFGPSDFNQSMTLSSEGTPWNTSDWNTSEWSTENFNKQEWLSGGGDGTYVQLRMTTTAPRQTLKWFRTDYRYKLTGPLE